MSTAGSPLDGRASFEERGFTLVPDIASEHERTELGRILLGARAPAREDGRTEVHRLDPADLYGLESVARAREAVVDVCGGAWSLEFAQWYEKPAGAEGAEIPWHQDRCFWTDERGLTVTAWIALDDVGPRNGCLHVRPASHLEAELRPHAPCPTTGIPTCSIDGTEAETAVALTAGSALLYHERLVHRSGANATHAPRRALVLGWTAAPESRET